VITSPTPRDVDPPCRQDPELWFATNAVDIAAAKKVCDRCPLIQRCLDYALTWQLQGVWAGLTEDERQDIQRKRGIVPQSIVTTHERRARHTDVSEERRAEIARLTALGFTAPQIAERLRITKRTVERGRADRRTA